MNDLFQKNKNYLSVFDEIQNYQKNKIDDNSSE